MFSTRHARAPMYGCRAVHRPIFPSSLLCHIMPPSLYFFTPSTKLPLPLPLPQQTSSPSKKLLLPETMFPLFSPPLLFTSIVILLTAFHQLLPITSPSPEPLMAAPLLLPNKCKDQCGPLHIPFPFHLNDSCGLEHHSDAFHLSCLNSTTIYLNIGSQSFRVLEFSFDGVLVDIPGTTSCRQYYDVNSFSFVKGNNGFYGLSVQNVLGLYDCEDSSVCKVDCERIMLPGCEGNSTTTSSTCCYPLSDHSVWQLGDGFSVFGCRGFSSWVVPPGANSGKRGVKLEWAVPRDSSRQICAANALIINATMVNAGVRCACQNGFVGDGFVEGVGCLKSCNKDGHEAFGRECYPKRHNKRKVEILAGILASVFILVSLAMLYALLWQSMKSDTWEHHTDLHQSTLSFHKACRTRLFTYQELEEATKGFEDGQKLVDGSNGTVYTGVLGDGLHVAVQKVQCETEQNLTLVLSRVEMLSQVSHRNVARLLGCCIESGYMPLVTYEFYANGTLEEHLLQQRDWKNGLDWYWRLNIAAETASALAYLQFEISPPIYHHDLKLGSIFLDQDYSVKIACFGLLNSSLENESLMCHNSEGSRFNKSDVYDLGMVLLEIISGSRHVDFLTMALPKIRSGKLEEIVDPLLYYHEQPPFHREQIEAVADLATRCLLFGPDGRLGMRDVARELLQIMKESLNGGSRRGSALEETFSNSSLLQMISMSPDSIYVP